MSQPPSDSVSSTVAGSPDKDRLIDYIDRIATILRMRIDSYKHVDKDMSWETWLMEQMDQSVAWFRSTDPELPPRRN